MSQARDKVFCKRRFDEHRLGERLWEGLVGRERRTEEVKSM